MVYLTHRIHLVDFYGFHVGKVAYMDLMGLYK